MFPFMSLTLPLRKKVVVDNDVDENLQKESSNDNQKDAHEETNEE